MPVGRSTNRYCRGGGRGTATRRGRGVRRRRIHWWKAGSGTMEASKPEICVQPNLEAMCEVAAEGFVSLARAACGQRGRFVIALCGGRTAPHFYHALARERHAARVAWEKVHVFWSDERYLPPESEQSNYGVTKRSLLAHVPIPAQQIHPMPTLLPSPEEAAEAYEEELTAYFSGETPRFDLMVMGLGEDGHTASLFPGSPMLAEEYQARLVVPAEAPAPPKERLTMTLPVFNNAENVWFLVSGAAKAEALERAVSGPLDPWGCPASAVRPPYGRVTWWVDEE